MTIKVDLLPTEKKRFGIDPVWIVLVLVILIFTVVFFSYGKKLEADISAREQDVHKIESEINELRGKLPGIAKMKTENDKLAAQIQTIKGLKNDPVRYANLLWEIADILPENVWVGNINIDPGSQSVTMSCTAIEYQSAGGLLKPLESIAQTIRAFQNSRYFKEATMSSTTAGKNSAGVPMWTFSLDTHYDADAALKSPDQIAPRGAAPGAPGVKPSGPSGPKGGVRPGTQGSSSSAPAAATAPRGGAAPKDSGSGGPAAAPGGAPGGASAPGSGRPAQGGSPSPATAPSTAATSGK